MLCEHPAVRAAACVPVPDETRGEEVKAFLVLQPDATAVSVPPETILDFARRRLAAFKVLRFVEYISDLALTPSQRVEKHKLLAQRSDQRAGAYDAVTRTWNPPRG